MVEIINLQQLLNNIESSVVLRESSHRRVITPFKTDDNIIIEISDSSYIFSLSESGVHEYIHGDLLFHIKFYVENFKDHIELVSFYKNNLCCRYFQQVYTSTNYPEDTIFNFEVMFETYLKDMLNNKIYVLEAYVEYFKFKKDKGTHSIMALSITDNENEGILTIGEGNKTYINNGEARQIKGQTSSTNFKIINNKVFTHISHIEGLFGIKLHGNPSTKRTSEAEFKRIFGTDEIFFKANIKPNVFLSFDNHEIILSIELASNSSILDFYLNINIINSKTELWLFHNHNDFHLLRDKANIIIEYKYIKNLDFKDTILEYSCLLKDIFTEQCIIYYLIEKHRKALSLDVDDIPNTEQIKYIKMLIY